MLWRSTLLLLSLVLLTGCASTAKRAAVDRQFVFERDTFAFPNELVWAYKIDPETGDRTKIDSEETPDYHHYCFPMVRAARQFYDYAEFRPDEEPADVEETLQAIDEVASRASRSDPLKEPPVVIRGYAGLRELSAAQVEAVKDAVGGNWQSWFQRGHWRLVFPFSRGGQAKQAAEYVELIEKGHTPILHLIRFPSLSINHAVLLFAVDETEEEIVFAAYDPNNAEEAQELTFDKSDRTFYFPPTASWKGGRVDVYEVYKDWLY